MINQPAFWNFRHCITTLFPRLGNTPTSRSEQPPLLRLWTGKSQQLTLKARLTMISSISSEAPLRCNSLLEMRVRCRLPGWMRSATFLSSMTLHRNHLSLCQLLLTLRAPTEKQTRHCLASMSSPSSRTTNLRCTNRRHNFPTPSRTTYRIGRPTSTSTGSQAVTTRWAGTQTGHRSKLTTIKHSTFQSVKTKLEVVALLVITTGALSVVTESRTTVEATCTMEATRYSLVNSIRCYSTE